MAVNIATLAVKFIADTFGLKQGAKAAEDIVTKSAETMGGKSLKAFGDFFKPGGNNKSMQAFRNFFASAAPKTVGGSPFAEGWTKPLSLLEKAGMAAKNAIGSQGGLASALTALGPIGVTAGAVVIGSVAAIGAAAYAGKKAWDQFWDSAARIDATSKLATRLDLTYGSLQKLTFLAGDSGIPVENLAKAMEHMGRTIGSGGQGLDKQFADQAKRISAIRDPAMRGAEAYKIFGKEAGAMIPLLTTLSGNAARFDRFSGKFGFIVEEKDAKNIERMNSAWGDLVFIGSQLADKFVSKFGGPIAAFLELGIDLIVEWADHLSELGVTWEDVGGFAVSVMGTLAESIVYANGSLKTMVGFLEQVYGGHQKIAGFLSGDKALQAAGVANILAGKKLIRSGVQDIDDVFSGKARQRFEDRITNGTDFGKRGEGFGSSGAGSRFAPSGDRFSSEAARIINASVAASSTPEQKAALATAKSTAKTAAAVEQISRVFTSNNLPVLALGGL